MWKKIYIVLSCLSSYLEQKLLYMHFSKLLSIACGLKHGFHVIAPVATIAAVVERHVSQRIFLEGC